MTQHFQPLNQLLAGNRIPISRTIHYALNIAGALRRIHSEGRCHGALTPELIEVSEAGARLQPATPGALENLTPYTAPEILEGAPADSRTDIFAFGAVLYEMATGRHAFLAHSPEALEEEIKAKGFSPIGNEGLDQVVKQCLEKDPAARWQRMQQVQMELKLLAIASRQSGQSAFTGRQEFEAAVRAELEGQASLLAELERAAAARTTELAQAVTTALDDVQVQFSEVEKVLEASHQRLDQFAQSAAQAAESTQREIASLQVGLAGEVHAIEQVTRGQATTLESVQASIARNEDYVERVVEALEALQNVIFNQADQIEQGHQTMPVAMAS
jgi:hypothetical protein